MQSMSSVKSRVSSGVRKLSYTPGLWEAYKTVWNNLPGQCQNSIFDIYSLKCWTPGSEQCGSFRTEGDCYNREHSWPKSWWGGSQNSAYTDMFHVMPSDGYVNGRRGNLPFGDVTSASYRSSEGHTRGSCSLGTCFEPAARTKGLLARAHFYVSLRYGYSFQSDKNALLRWHEENPPQDWETELNDRIQKEQGNRNPYIDYPSLVAQHFR